MALPPMRPRGPEIAHRLGWVTKKQATQAQDAVQWDGGMSDGLDALAEIAGLSAEVVTKIREYVPAPGVTLPQDLADEATWIRASRAFEKPGAGARELADFRRGEAAVRQSSWTSRLFDRVRKGESLEAFGATRTLDIGKAPHSIEAWTLSAEAGGGALMWIRFDTNATGVLFELRKTQSPSATFTWIHMPGDSTIRYMVFAIDNLQWSKPLPPDETKARDEWNHFVTALRGVFEPLGITLATADRDATLPTKG